jgi:SAM-dependent methyltransferase
LDAQSQKIIWDHFQGAEPESFSQAASRLRFIARRLGDGRVLNIGIGDGTFEAAALARGVELWALDPSESAVESLRERLGLGDRARVGWAQELPFDDRFFDVVVVSEVLEHLDDATLAASLREIRRVLHPGGRIIGTVPAREDLRAQMVVCPHCTRQFHRWGHERSFDVATLRQLLETEFRVEEARERLFVTWSALNWKGKLAALARRLLERLGSRGANRNIWFVARRDESPG